MSNNGTQPVEVTHEHFSRVAQARSSSEEDLKEIDYALGQEFLADAYAYGQSIRYASTALVTNSVDPLIEGAHYFESAASTIPIIGPLIKERFDSAKTVKRIRYLDRALTRNPNTKIVEAEQWEMEILNGQREISVPKQAAKHGFISGMFWNWVDNVRPRGAGYTIESVSKASFDLASMPFRASYALEATHHYDIQFARLQSLPEAFKSTIGLKIDNENDLIIVDKKSVEAGIEEYERRHRKRVLSLSLATVSTLAAGNFIQNEATKSYSYAEEMFSSDPIHSSTESDPVTSTALSISLILAHIIPATLTFAPLRKASKKVSEHSARISHIREYIDLMTFARDNGVEDVHQEPLDPAL